ncbi:MAG TPA: DUF5677 domain-containing protein [Sedimentisphaerales bacterium]|nr:DUF5677 domain-containing protein [Sedimentisphaerales bacterium]
MESKEDHDIFSIVANTIMKWYEQTHTTMAVARKPRGPLNSEFMGVLLAARKQTEGALTTLANKNILSTHVLLRVLVETHIFLMWALNAPAKDEKTKSEEVYKRFKRWDYARLIKDKKLSENLPQTPETESNVEKVNGDIEKYQKEGVKELPNIRQLYEDLGSEWKELYARLYMKYCRAVHLNRNVTTDLSSLQYEDGEAKAVLYKDDIEPDGDELLVLASISCDINKAIRGFYNWHSDAMQDEYEQLRSKLVKT